MKKLDRENWFIDRIGKMVFRNSFGCNCEECKDVEVNGILISNEMQAIYLSDCEGQFPFSGNPIRYFDTQEEVEQWLKTLS